MNESDLEAEQPLSRLFVDQLGAFGGETAELELHVVDLVGDVVHARPMGGDEPADGRLLAERSQELDASRADEHGRGLDALVLDERAVLELGAEQSCVRCERLVQIVDGHAEMMDAAGSHGTDANGGLVLRRRQGAHGADRLGRP